MNDKLQPIVVGANLDCELQRAQLDYAAARPASRAQAKMANYFLPGGSTRSVLDFEPFPFRVAEAEGPYLYDVDGFRYVDFLGDYTAGLLGHNPIEVREAVGAALARGWSLGALADDEHRLAEVLCDRFPSIQQIRFTNSGTEANLMAIALARYHSGGSKVLVFDGAYHGGLLSFAAGGESIQAPYDYVVCPYNDLDAVAKALSENIDIACVLVEPMMGAAGCIPGRHDFLAGLRDMCQATGVVLIFDEVMTSRMSIGGAQRRLSCRPDLTTLGKYLGGGFSFGAFGGRADMMAAFNSASGGALSHGGTFNNNVVTMSAGVAASTLLTPSVLDDLFQRGEALRNRLSRLLADYTMSVTGWGSLMNFHATSVAIHRPSDLNGADPRVVKLLFHKLLERGYYIAPRGFVALSLMVTDDHLDDFYDAVGDSLEEMVTSGALMPTDRVRQVVG